MKKGRSFSAFCLEKKKTLELLSPFTKTTSRDREFSSQQQRTGEKSNFGPTPLSSRHIPTPPLSLPHLFELHARTSTTPHPPIHRHFFRVPYCGRHRWNRREVAATAVAAVHTKRSAEKTQYGGPCMDRDQAQRSVYVLSMFSSRAPSRAYAPFDDTHRKDYVLHRAPIHLTPSVRPFLPSRQHVFPPDFLCLHTFHHHLCL